MRVKQFNNWMYFLAGILFLSSCQDVVVQINNIPPNTPSGQPIYIAGNFNSWDPGDEWYQLTLNEDSTYTITLPRGLGTVEYKFTRGDWTTVEKDICGYEVENHQFLLGESDTVNHVIESWNDLDPVNCPRLTLVLKDIPANTPADEIIAIAGNFNSWDPDESSELSKDSAGNYLITIDRLPRIEEIEFKITRGDLSKAESDLFGNGVPNRRLRFGIQDTVELQVEGWIDKPDKSSNRVVVIIDEMPKFYDADEIYLVSPLNGWMPGDKNYLFQIDQYGRYFYPLPRKKRSLEYKITRGGWDKVEVDRFGYDIPNRSINLETEDTVYLTINGWKDLEGINDYEVTIVLENMPLTTPGDAEFYLTGNFNGWRAGRSRDKFVKDYKDRLVTNVSRGKGMLEFKINRGSWNSVEVDHYGSEIDNRAYFFKDVDTIYVSVDNWKDLPALDIEEVTLVINELPEDTPALDQFYLAADFNNWDPEDESSIFSKLPDGRPYITFPRHGRSSEYKITRGGWHKVEVDQYGNTIDNRTLTYGFSDTIYIKVTKWRDFGGNY